MADVAFNSSDHKLTASDVPQGEEGLQKSSQAAGGLAKGQEKDYWTPEPAAQLLGKAVADFFSACDEAFSQEKDALDEFGTNVDLAIAEFARVNQSTGDELKKIQDSITNPEIREKLGRGLLQAGAPAQTDGSDTLATEATAAPTGADAASSGPSHFGQSASSGPTVTGQ
jgi:hypothetical protein